MNIIEMVMGPERRKFRCGEWFPYRHSSVLYGNLFVSFTHVMEGNRGGKGVDCRAIDGYSDILLKLREAEPH